MVWVQLAHLGQICSDTFLYEGRGLFLSHSLNTVAQVIEHKSISISTLHHHHHHHWNTKSPKRNISCSKTLCSWCVHQLTDAGLSFSFNSSLVCIITHDKFYVFSLLTLYVGVFVYMCVSYSTAHLLHVLLEHTQLQSLVQTQFAVLQQAVEPAMLVHHLMHHIQNGAHCLAVICTRRPRVGLSLRLWPLQDVQQRLPFLTHLQEDRDTLPSVITRGIQNEEDKNMFSSWIAVIVAGCFYCHLGGSPKWRLEDKELALYI